MTVKRPQPFINPWDLLTDAEVEAIQAGEGFDWLPVFERSHEFGDDSRGAAGVTLMFPPGVYFFSDTWHIRRQVRIVGAGGGGWMCGTVFVFPHGKAGVMFEWLAGGRSDWSRIESVRVLEYGVQNPLGDAHGIVAKAPVAIEHVCVQGFVHGICLYGNAGHPTDPSNCNTWRINSVRLDSNWGDGLHVEGADANAGVGIGIDASDNHEHGVEDRSFLGNTYVGLHADNNPRGAVSNLGLNSYSTYLGTYAETNQPDSQIGSPAIALGGIARFAGSGGWITMAGGELAVQKLRARNAATPGQRVTLRIGPSSTLPGDAESWLCEDTSQTYRLRYGAFPGWWTRQYQGIDSGHVFGLCTAAAPHWHQGTPGPKALLGDVYIGGMLHAAGTKAPTAGNWPLGSRVHNLAPAVGGYEGWVCIAAGSPGTWRPFGKIE